MRYFFFILLFVSSNCFGAARYWIGTTSAAWSNTLNWSTTSGGVGGAAVPLSTDAVTLDVNGNNACTLDGAGDVCVSFTVTSGYTNTFTITNNITVSNSVTLGANMTIT